MTLFEQLSEMVQAGNAPEVKRLTEEALEQGVSPVEILNKGLIAGMSVVGELFKRDEIFVPEVLIAARAMKGGMEILRPKLGERGNKPVGVVIAGTVKGDLHDIGKNIVSMMLEGAGFEVVDLGTDVAPERFVSAIEQRKGEAVILAMSALLTTTMLNMRMTIEALKKANIRDQVKVMVGGAPVTQNFAREIGADGYGSNASAAVEKAKELLGIPVPSAH
jgi:5-methyltetrahydrofolate--homocysteine methyltransferase